MEENFIITLNLLYLDPERKTKCYNEYFINRYIFFFHTEEFVQSIKIYNSEVCVQRSTSNKFEVDYYKKLENAIKLQYHNEYNIVFLFKL